LGVGGEMHVVAGDNTGLIELPSQASVAGPGLHALIIGVGFYPFLTQAPNNQLEMGHLDGPVPTALRLAEFLLSLPPEKGSLAAPLRSLRLLLSPSPGDKARGLTPPAGVLPATIGNIRLAAKQWRQNATSDDNNITLFYFAGHGIQRGPAEGVLLPEDALKNYPQDDSILYHTFDVNNLYNGMAKRPISPGQAQEKMANTQFYFFDACRAPLEALTKFANESPPQIFGVRADGVDDRVAPRFFGAAPGTVAYSLPRGTTFGEDLLRCLDGAAADLVKPAGTPIWAVTIDRLMYALEALKEQWNHEKPAFRRTFEVGNITATTPHVLVLKSPPSVPCLFTLIPDAAQNFARIRVVALRNGSPTLIHHAECPFSEASHDCFLPAGQYIICGCNANAGPICPFCSSPPTGTAQCGLKAEDLAFVMPPRFEHDVVFS
jgi:hypothetical protein